jgi:hypothetical protein
MPQPKNEVENNAEGTLGIDRCPECGVPERVTKHHVWLNSGVIVQSNNMSKRVGFIECENLDPLYEGIGRIIGSPIDHLVMDVARRHTIELFRNLIQPEVRAMLRNRVMGLDFIVEFMATNGVLNGNGKYEVVDLRYEGDDDDYAVVRIAEPFSVPLAVGINMGASEIITEKPHKAIWRQVSPGVYEIKAYVCPHDRELERLMPLKEYYHQDGDIELERCATCGGPTGLSGFEWDLDRGVIINVRNGRRLKIIDPGIHDALFEELERKVGEIVPAAVVEAQRIFIKAGFYSSSEGVDESDLREQFALRGMGNLKELRMGARRMRMRIENAADYLMLTGLAQGLYELAYNVESRAEWELSEKGHLSVEITPK